MKSCPAEDPRSLPLLWARRSERQTSRADEGFRAARRIEGIDERLACYDELARTTPSPSGEPVDPTPTPSHLSEAWKLGAKQRGARHLTDILGYRPTYIISRWSSNPNTQPSSPATDRTTLEPEDLNRNELKFQISFKTELISREFFDDIGVAPLLRPIGVDSMRLWFGYTHRVNWQAFNHKDSRPFREINYEPEAILTFGTGNEGDGFKLVNLGLSHESNGQTETQSRGWSRAYAQGGWEWGRLSLLARAWHRIPENANDDDNPDIKDYMGRGDLAHALPDRGRLCHFPALAPQPEIALPAADSRSSTGQHRCWTRSGRRGCTCSSPPAMARP